MKNLKTIIGVGLLAALPIITLAQIKFQPAPETITRPEQIIDILNTLINWVFTILLIVAVFFIFRAAFLYLTAAGDPDKVKQASNQLIFAAVAIAVAFVALGVRFIVGQLLGGVPVK